MDGACGIELVHDRFEAGTWQLYEFDFGTDLVEVFAQASGPALVEDVDVHVDEVGRLDDLATRERVFGRDHAAAP